MQVRQSITQNLRWLAAANFAVKPLWFVFLLLSTRLLGPEEFGRFMFALSFVGVITYFLEGGIDVFSLRELSAEPGRFRAFFPQTSALKLLSGVLVAIVTLGVSFIVGLSGDVRLLVMIGAIHGIVSGMMLHFRMVFRAFEVMKFEALSILLEKGAIVLVCGAGLLISRRAEVFMVAFVAAYVIACAGTLLMVGKHIGFPRWMIEWRRLWDTILKPAFPYALMGIFMVVYYRASTLMLQWITGNETFVGYYNAGYRFVEAFALLPSIIVMPFYATFARGREDKSLVRLLLPRAARALLALSMLVSVPFVVFYHDMTGLLFGPAFLPAASTIGLTVLTMVPVGMTWLFVNLAGAIGRQRTLNYFIIGVTVCNILLNYALIRNLGVLGAAVTTLLTETAMAVSAMWVVRDYMDWESFGAIAGGVFVPAVLVYLLGAFRVLPGSFAIQLAAAIAILLSGFLAFRVVRIDEIKKLLGR